MGEGEGKGKGQKNFPLRIDSENIWRVLRFNQK